MCSKMFFQTAALAAAVGLAAGTPCKPHTTTTVSGWETAYTATGTAEVAAAAATAKTSSPTSKVKGRSFDRIVSIWFENEDYDKAIGDPNFASFAAQGITLTNYYAVCHPSEGNYVSAVAGDYFGMQNDDFNMIDFNVSTVIDLLESKHVSWGLYQEDMPYSGFEGMAWLNQQTGANDYVRKHNPAVIHNSVAHYEQRLSQIKNVSLIDTANSQFHKDLKSNKLPQWIFITPNMTSDGHDSSATVGGAWLKAFLTPLLEDKNFMDNTLVLITWDENETYSEKNRILSILLGDAVPHALKGTSDDNFYNHYSAISTVEANWDLPTLGRWDVGANVFQMVADKTGDKLREWGCGQDFENFYYNLSYAGPFNTGGGNQQYPAPNLKLDKSASGRKILPSIKETWKGSKLSSYYKDTIEIPDGLNPPKGYAPSA